MKTMRFNPRLAASMLAIGLAGCVSTGQQKLPTLSVPERYSAGGPAATGTTDIEATFPSRPAEVDEWWRGFGDATLDRLVDDVLRANSDLAAAGLTLRKARQQAGLSETDLWPKASGSVGSSASRSTGFHDEISRSQSASVSLGWEVDLWGKLRAQRDASHWEALATAEDLQNTTLALIAETCSDYWQLAYLNQSIASGEDNLARLEKTRQLVQVQYRAGAVSRLELREAEQNLESRRIAQSQLVQQRVEVRNAIAVLRDGKPWPQAEEPANLDAVTPLDVESGLPAELLGRRPDLRAAELRLRASMAQVKATATSYYPALSLTGSLGGSSTSLADAVKNPVAMLGAGLSLPFLNFRQAQLETDIAGTGYEIAATQFRGTLQTALGEVDNALSARTQFAQQIASAQSSYEAAREIERMYEVRYRVGSTDLRVWLDAQQTLRDSELALAQARRSQLDNDIVLVKALGGSARVQ